MNKTILLSPKKMQAFSLIELLLTLSVLAILASIAIPASQSFLAKNRTTANLNAIAHALYYARSEAIVRAEKIIFCKSADGKSCNGHWRDGQLLLNAMGEVLRIFPALPKTDNLIWNSSAGGDDTLEWLPTGYTNGQRGTFYYCTAAVSSSGEIVLLNTGRWYITTMDAEDFEQFCR